MNYRRWKIKFFLMKSETLRNMSILFSQSETQTLFPIVVSFDCESNSLLQLSLELAKSSKNFLNLINFVLSSYN